MPDDAIERARAIPLSSALVVVGFCDSTAEGKRLIRGGGAFVDGEKAIEDYPVVTGQMIQAGRINPARLLAFASQQAPEGWQPIEKFEGEPGIWDAWTVYLDDFGKPTGMLHQSAKFVRPETFVNGGWYDRGGNPLEWQSDEIEDGCTNAPSRHVTHFRPLPAPPAMLDAAPSVTLGEVG